MSTISKPASKSAPVAVTPSRGKTLGNKATATRSARPAKPALPKPAAAPASKVPVKPAPIVLSKPTVAKPAKIKKPKLVRDSFTIPKSEYGVLAALKERAVKLSNPAKKSELLRAGLNALSPRAESAVADGLSKIADSFGLKKLEDVFDHRVAAALERLGYPSPREMRRLVDQVDELVTLLKAPRKRG